MDVNTVNRNHNLVILKDRPVKLSENTRKRLASFLVKVKDDPPKDEKGLSQLLLSGIAPSFSDMMNILGVWLNDTSK